MAICSGGRIPGQDSLVREYVADGVENFVERIEAAEIEFLAGQMDMRELVDSSESISEPLRWFLARNNSSSLTGDSFKSRNSFYDQVDDLADGFARRAGIHGHHSGVEYGAIH